MSQNEEKIESVELKKKTKINKEDKLENDVVRKFDGIFRPKETIIKSFKPKHNIVYLQNLLKPIFFSLLLLIVVFCINIKNMVLNKSDFIFVVCFIVALTIIVELIIFFITKQNLKNIYFVITNQRIIVSFGFLDIEFKSIDLKNIKDVELKFHILENLTRKKTGSIMFDSCEKSDKHLNFFTIEKPLDSYIQIENILEKNSVKDNRED